MCIYKTCKTTFEMLYMNNTQDSKTKTKSKILCDCHDNMKIKNISKITLYIDEANLDRVHIWHAAYLWFQITITKIFLNKNIDF